MNNHIFLNIESVCIESKKRQTKKENWKDYKKEVWRITKNQNLFKLENNELRGFKSYHLDHIISIWNGWKLNISPCFIGGLHNLRFIPAIENLKKGTKSHIL